MLFCAWDSFLISRFFLIDESLYCDFCMKLDMKYMPFFHSTGNFLSGTLNRVHHMLGSGRNNRKIMCYVAGGVVVFITIIYMLSSKLRSADWFQDPIDFWSLKKSILISNRSIFDSKKFTIVKCQHYIYLYKYTYYLKRNNEML